MTPEQESAVDEVLRIAATNLQKVEGEFGCCHNFNDMVTNTRPPYDYEEPDELVDGMVVIDCTWHDEAAYLAGLATILGRPVPVLERW